jgi:adenylate cyclase
LSPTVRPIVVLVDDDEDSRIIFSIALEDGGFHVEMASDGEAGLRLIRELHPAAVVLDIEMPRLDGRSVITILRAESGTRKLPVLAITASASSHNRGELMPLGFDAVLIKPFIPAVLVAAVRQAVASLSPPASVDEPGKPGEKTG